MKKTKINKINKMETINIFDFFKQYDNNIHNKLMYELFGKYETAKRKKTK